MVGFNDTATVTFVPFFATPPETTRPDLTRTDVNRPDSNRADADRVVALQVAHALAALQLPILRTLEVSVHDGHVTLRGRVRTYYERQLATVHAKRTAGVKAVRGEITVAG